MSARAVPFYCPYCGDEDLVPEPAPGGSGEGHGHWACRACQRAFRLSLTALVAATEPDAAGPGAAGPGAAASVASGVESSGGVRAGTTPGVSGSANGTAVAPLDVEESD
ncbi:hypothetical protein [Parafrankia elaeagni]|uniref:hypothetical protein n=1 Tax=Parafrankia elaeagni TaxID=222534 RepID=UPI0003A5809E|nr:hypothetical protein [Parafrankia elaeagni]